MKNNSKTVVFTDRSTESVNIYLKEIRKYKILTQEQEYALWEEMKKGSTSARTKLINSNLRYVVSRAKQYLGNRVRLEDLIQVGNIGLTEATDKFDATLGVRLILFARWQIDAELQKVVTEHKRNAHDLTLDDVAFRDEDCETMLKDMLEADEQYNADWDIRYETALRAQKDKVKEMGLEWTIGLFEDYLVMTPQGYTLTDLARKYRITEEKVKDTIKKIGKKLEKNPDL